jgi:molecular chaperone IbpA
LNDQVEIKGADMINGMLKIFLERIIPEHKKPKKIAIGEPKPMGDLLTEEDRKLSVK